MNKFSNCDIYYPGSNIEFVTIFSQVYNNGKINYFRLTEFPNSGSFNHEKIVPGEAIIERVGDKLTIVVVGALLDRVRRVVAQLENQGNSVEILYLHSLKPIDFAAIGKSLRKTKKLLVVEENHVSDGIFSTIVNKFGGDFIFAKRQLAIHDFIKTYGSYEALTQDAGLSEKQISEAALELLS
jgi:transketolase